MKTTPRQLLLCVALACFGPLTVAALAEDTSAPVDKNTPSAAAAAAADSSTSSTTPVSSPSTDVPAAAATATTSTSSTTSATSAEALPPTAAAAPVAPAAPAAASASDSLRRIDEAPAAPAAPKAQTAQTPARPPRARRSGNANERVAIGGNAALAKGETADSVVAIMGNATSAGDVIDSVVSVLGNTRVSGKVGDSAVAVLGNVYVDGAVKDVVAVMGNVELGPNAEVRGDVVCVGGVVNRDPKAIVRGNTPAVGMPSFGFNPEWLQSYVQQCALKLRLLAFGPNLGWAWLVAATFLLVYVVIALLFRGGVEKTVSVLETRPGGTILAALITVILTPIVFVLLSITVIGLVVMPCAVLFGRTVVLAWIGRRITVHFNEGPLTHPAFAVLIGGIIVTALYLVPALSLVVYNLIGVLGVGVVVYTLLLMINRGKPARPAPAASVPAPATVSAGVAPEGVAFAVPASMGGGMATSAVAAEPVVGAPVPPVAAATLPRAGFWIRIGALFIDVVLVAIVFGVAGDMIPRALHLHGPGPVLLVLAAYGAILWKLKGATIGDIVCGLKVVRLDNRPVDWATAIVRALGCFLSLFIVGLGFIWVAIDDEKQSWHDKIAGTTVVHARGAVTLV